MLIWNGKRLLSVMTCVHMKVCIFIEAFKVANQEVYSQLPNKRVYSLNYWNVELLS